MRRRLFLLSAAGAALSGALRAAPGRGAPVRFGLTPVFLDDHVAFLEIWRRYLEARLGRRVTFIQRGSYREITDLLRQEQLDFAWICGYPYVRYKKDLRLLAVPLYAGKPLYRSYVIVPEADGASASILDLRGRVFAYSDPNSNSGFLYANYRLVQVKEDPGTFFRKTFFTWAHRKVVEAVAAGLAQGGSVDGYIWDTLRKDGGDPARRTRVIERSPEFGFPPIVARAGVPKADFDAVRGTLLGMAGDADGQALLAKLNLEGFAAGSPELFADIERMMKTVHRTSRDAA